VPAPLSESVPDAMGEYPIQGWFTKRFGVENAMSWIFWAILIAAILHIAEEYRGEWLVWVRRYVPGVTLFHFVLVNTAFLLLCVAGAVVGVKNVVFSLSIASLVFSNALMHIIPTVVWKEYSPGVITAVLLYIPLGAYAYVLAFDKEEVSLGIGAVAIVLGIFWMMLPIIGQQVRIKVEKSQSR